MAEDSFFLDPTIQLPDPPVVVRDEAVSNYLRELNLAIEEMYRKIAVVVNMPVPSFLYKTDGSQDDIASGSWVDLALQTKVYDTHDCFSTPSFTAKVAGKYIFFSWFLLTAMDNTSSNYQIRLLTTQANYLMGYEDSNIPGSDYNDDFGGSVLCPMAVDDTAKMQLYQASGSPAQTDVNANSYFGGFLAIPEEA